MLYYYFRTACEAFRDTSNSPVMLFLRETLTGIGAAAGITAFMQFEALAQGRDHA